MHGSQIEVSGFKRTQLHAFQNKKILISDRIWKLTNSRMVKLCLVLSLIEKFKRQMTILAAYKIDYKVKKALWKTMKTRKTKY